jgi:phage/plasmid-like protein (TIGR03299 family)
MSHELLDTDSMVSANDADGRKTWHFSLGTPVTLVDGDLKVEDAQEVAGLDWMTEHRPLYVPRTVGIDETGAEVVEYDVVETHRAAVRVDTDTTLGVVGMQHALVQNHELFDLAAALQAESEGGVLVETAGSLKGNRLVWVLAKINRDVDVAGDVSHPYLLIGNSHDGTMSLRVQTTLIRVVCWNTLSWAITNCASAWIARHSSGVAGKVDEIKAAIGMSYSYVDAWEAEVQRFIDTPVKRPAFDKFVERLVPLEPNPTDRQVANATERRDAIRQLHEGPTVAPFTGTAWGALNAGTEWQQWVRPVQGERAERAGERDLMGETSSDTTHIKNLLVKSVPELATV